MSEDKVIIIDYAKEEKGFDAKYKYNELKIKLCKNGSACIFHTDQNKEDFIYLYPSQLEQLKKILGVESDKVKE